MASRGKKKKRNRPHHQIASPQSKNLNPLENPPTRQALIDEAVRSVVRSESRSETFAGPLPPPEALARYNEILPGLAERIVAMAERQSQHRQGLEKTVIDGRTRNESMGQWFAFILAALVLGGSISLIFVGKPIEGLIALTAEIAGLSYVFVYGRKRQENELAQKRQTLTKST
jgi:uncharacterized membrane protein